MSEDLRTREQLIEEISAKIAARVKQLKNDGQDPNTDEAIKRMMEHLKEETKAAVRQAFEEGKLDDGDDDVVVTQPTRKGDEFAAGDEDRILDRGNFNPYDIHTPVAKILLPKRVLAKYYPDRTVEAIEEFKELNDQLYLVGKLLATARGVPYETAVRTSKTYAVVQNRLKTDAELRKALYTTGTGAGAEWIPTGFSSQLLEKIRLELRVAGLFVVVNMPTNPYKFPVQSSGANSYLIPEATTDSPPKFTATTPGTANFEFNAKKIGARIPFSEELNEDSIINMLDFTRDELAVAIAEGVEDAILNGDDSTTHMDSDVTASNDRRKAFKGLRYFALNNAGTSTLDLAGGAPSLGNLRNLRKLLGKYGVNPKNLAFVISASEYIKFLDITEVKTADVFGAQATVLNGQLAAIDGIPIFVSEFVREDLNASGVYDGVTTNRTVIYLLDKRGFMMGQRGGVTISTYQDVETDQISVIAKYRVAFKDPYDATSSSNIQAVLGINVAY